MRFGKREKSRPLWGRSRRRARAASDSVAAEERNALLDPGGRQADAPEETRDAPSTFTGGDPTQRLLAALGRFQRCVARAQAGADQAAWSDDCMEELVGAVEIALAKTGRINNERIAIPLADRVSCPAWSNVGRLGFHIQMNSPDDIHETVSQSDAVIRLLDAIDVLIEYPVVKDVGRQAVKSWIIFPVVISHGCQTCFGLRVATTRSAWATRSTWATWATGTTRTTSSARSARSARSAWST